MMLGAENATKGLLRDNVAVDWLRSVTPAGSRGYMGPGGIHGYCHTARNQPADRAHMAGRPGTEGHRRPPEPIRHYRSAAAGRIFGYGAFRIGPDGPDQLVVDYIPYPEQLYLEVHGILYPDGSQQGA